MENSNSLFTNPKLILIESLLSHTTSILLLIFTYVVPLLSTLRTIHTRDQNSYTQWLAYWLLIHLLSPLLTTSYLQGYKFFHLSFVLWLSLPRFQGAMYIYNEVVDVFIDKYGVERTVDDSIVRMKKSAMEAMWNIAKDVGWGFLYQIGGVVSYVQDSAASFVDENTNANANAINDDEEEEEESNDAVLFEESENASDGCSTGTNEHVDVHNDEFQNETEEEQLEDQSPYESQEEFLEEEVIDLNMDMDMNRDISSDNNGNDPSLEEFQPESSLSLFMSAKDLNEEQDEQNDNEEQEEEDVDNDKHDDPTLEGYQQESSSSLYMSTKDLNEKQDEQNDNAEAEKDGDIDSNNSQTLEECQLESSSSLYMPTKALEEDDNEKERDGIIDCDNGSTLEECQQESSLSLYMSTKALEEDKEQEYDEKEKYVENDSNINVSLEECQQESSLSLYMSTQDLEVEKNESIEEDEEHENIEGKQNKEDKTQEQQHQDEQQDEQLFHSTKELSCPSLSSIDMESSSPSNIETEMETTTESETYVKEFINMLKKDLYVFASVVPSDSNAILLKQKDSLSTKKLKLYIFTVLYQSLVGNGQKNEYSDEKKENEPTSIVDEMTIEQIMTCDTDDIDASHVRFVFTLPESRKKDLNSNHINDKNDGNDNDTQNDGFSFPLSAISSIQESTTGIQFLSNASSLSSSSSEERCDEEDVIAEIVLSDDEDRNILLFGLNNLLSSVTTYIEKNID